MAKFPQFCLATRVDEADILVTSAEYRCASSATLKVFQAVLGRTVTVVSYTWIKESVRKEFLLDKVYISYG